MANPDLFIFAGEASGDLHGSHLVQELFALNPNLKVCGVGGPKMRVFPFDCLMMSEEFQVMGFTDVLLALPRIMKNFYRIRNFILANQPKVVVLIDYAEFNLRLASSLRKNGFRNKLVHYISPSVWAWRKNRAKSMEKTLDLLLTIFPFENAFFKNTNLACKYVGNPLINKISGHIYNSNWKSIFSMPENFFALFPGSRSGEIERNLPLQLQAAKKLRMPFAISCAHPNLEKAIISIAQSHTFHQGIDFKLIPETYSYDLMKDASFAIAKSGTATLELALHGCPTVVTYQLTHLNYLVAKHLFKINLPYYCIANILLGERALPEMVGVNLDPLHLAEQALLLNKEDAVKTALRLQNVLTQDNASLNAARAIQDLVGSV